MVRQQNGNLEEHRVLTRRRLRAKGVGKIHDEMYIILLMLAVQIFLTCSVLLFSLSYPPTGSDLCSLSCNTGCALARPGVTWHITITLGRDDKEFVVLSNTFILGTLGFSG